MAKLELLSITVGKSDGLDVALVLLATFKNSQNQKMSKRKKKERREQQVKRVTFG